MQANRPFYLLSLTALALVLALGATGAIRAKTAPQKAYPVAVSPGSAAGSVTGDACPTFSWGSVPEARSFELVVYRVGEGEEKEPVLRQTFAGSVNNWTPSLDRCLEPGGQYAWSVRALGRSEASNWSAPSLFEVAAGPSEEEFEKALEVVRKYLARQTVGSAATAGSGAAAALPAGGRRPEALGPASDAGTNAALTPTVFSVDGSIDLGGEVVKDGKAFVHDPGGEVGENTALGRGSLSSVTPGVPSAFSGRFNVAVGFNTLPANSSGRNNTGLGNRALQFNETGLENTAVGQDSLRGNVGGNRNSALGKDSLRSSTGSGNIGIGFAAGKDLTTGDNNIHIGDQGLAGETATIKIGTQGVQTKAFVAGIHGTPLTGSNVVVTSAGQLGTGPVTIREYEFVETAGDALADNVSTSFIANCPAGKKVLGGGWRMEPNFASQLFVAQSRATTSRTSWRVSLENKTGQSVTIFIQAICASVD